MGHLRLPEGAEAGFRIESLDAFDRRFAIKIYGNKNRAWFVAMYRGRRNLDSGVQQIAMNEWQTLRGLINQCNFWSLPEDGAHLVDPNWVVLDGDWLTISGRIGETFHRVHRFVEREPGLEEVMEFGQRVSGFYERHPVSGHFWLRKFQNGDAGQ